MSAPVVSGFSRTTADVRLKPVGADLKVGPYELLTLRAATVDDAPAIHDLISSYIAEGHLLPRTLSEIAVHAHRFVLAVDEAPLKGCPTEAAVAPLNGRPAGAVVGDPLRGATNERVVGCVDLAPLSRTVAEVRSLVVSDELRSNGVGRRLIDAVVASARRAGFERICAFTHAPSYFVQRGFSLVPHEWLPEKIRTDCGSCALFRRCRQYAVVLPLARVTDACVPLASLHG